MIRRKRNGRVAMMASFLLALSLSSPPLSADAEQQHAVEVAEAALTEISDVFRYAAVELRESMLHFDAGTESELPTAEYKLTQRFPHFKYERAEKEWCQTTSYDGKVYRILGSQVDDAGALPVLTIADRVPDYFFLARGFSFYGVPVRGISDDGPTRDWRTWFAVQRDPVRGSSLTGQLVHENDRKQVILSAQHGEITVERLVIDITDKPYLHSYEMSSLRDGVRIVSMVALETRLVEDVRIPVKASIEIGDGRSGNRISCELISFRRIDPSVTTGSEACALTLPKSFRCVDHVERVAYDMKPDGTRKYLPMYDVVSGKISEGPPE